MYSFYLLIKPSIVNRVFNKSPHRIRHSAITVALDITGSRKTSGRKSHNL